MKQLKFSKKRLALYISAVLTASLTSTISAQVIEEDKEKEDQVEVIEVRGIKGSLTGAMNLKRDMRLTMLLHLLVKGSR